MINIPYNVPLAPQIMPTQTVPVQTSHNNFQAFQQPQTNTQQMQTNPVYPLNPQDQYKPPMYQVQQSDVFMANQYVPNVLQGRPCPPIFHPFNNVPPPVQTQPNYGPLLQNILEQIRGQVSNTAPIFILPGGCQQSTNHHQQAGTGSQVGGPQATGQPTSFNYPSSVHCPPTFYPFPIPMPVYEPFAGQTRNRESSRGCGCCHRRQESLDSKNYSLNCCCNLAEQEDHRCTATNDDTICSKRNCPASVSLQALASQLLSLQGIISCAATRLILRKVPGSNITNTMEDTMEKAQKAITMLTKDQLLTESRNAHQVNALINLHMTTNPPANIVPLLTLIQLKVNVLKAQIESLINKKVMECQGFGYEVETSGPIDPTVLTMKTNEELRHLLSALRQKETDERVNLNFSLYHSQRVIAEGRLNNVQAKIRQVEAEFDRRRSVSIPVPSLTSRVIQQFTGSTCTFGYAQTKLFEPYPPENPLESPDPFLSCIRNPRRLYLKPREETTEQKDQSKTTGTSPCTDTGTGEGAVNSSKEQSVGPRSSDDSCSCHSSSEDSIGDKKKLRLRIDRAGRVVISSPTGLQLASMTYSSPNELSTLFRPTSESVDDEVEILEIPPGEGKKIELVDLDSEEDNTVDKVNHDVDKAPKTEGKTIDRRVSREFKDKTPDTPKEQKTDGQVVIKREPADMEEFDLRRVKAEPRSTEKIETDIPIKEEPIEDKRSPLAKILQLGLRSKKMKEQKIKEEIDSREQETHDGRTPIKKEPADAVEEFDLRRVKIEQSVEKGETKTDVSIKKEPVDKPRRLSRTIHIGLNPKMTKRHMEPKENFKEIPDLKQEADDGQLAIEEHESGARTKNIKVEDVKYQNGETGESGAGSSAETGRHDAVLKPEMIKREKEDGYKEAKATVYTNAGLNMSEEKKVKTELCMELKDKAIEDTKVPQIADTKVQFEDTKALQIADTKVQFEDTEVPQIADTKALQFEDTKVHQEAPVKDAKDNVVIPPPLKAKIKEEPDEPKTFFGVKLRKTGLLPEPKSEDEFNLEIKQEHDEKSGTSKQGMSADEQKIEGQGSSEVMKSYLEVVLKQKEESNPKVEDDKSKVGRHGNVQIVSMMRHVEYDRSYGDFEEWIDVKHQTHGKLINKNHRESDKNANDIARFPPLQHTARRTVIDIAENIFHQKEIESDCLNLRNRNTSYPDSETENSIASTIYSLIENPLASLGSFLSNIPNFQDIVSSLCYKPSIKSEHLSSEGTENKKIPEEDDWILVPWDNLDDGTSTEGREVFSNVHEMKQSIIVDKETKNYVVIGGSISGQFRELSRNGLHRPYRTRRTLMIRSRLKNPGKSRRESQRPFTIVKRLRKNKISVSEEMKPKPQLKASEHCHVDTVENQNDINSNNAMLSKNCSFLSVDHSLPDKESMHDLG
ncbi:uncharacterized protein LOC105662035 isoform X1 [Megachile rotundata]|uniref:uncharacterized protein LOC105662035 isoform X1 n=1 Tax=Megachile rotundata TaxID=143995 RepID=UPI003FD6BE54